jgi:hypothetical protein
MMTRGECIRLIDYGGSPQFLHCKVFLSVYLIETPVSYIGRRIRCCYGFTTAISRLTTGTDTIAYHPRMNAMIADHSESRPLFPVFDDNSDQLRSQLGLRHGEVVLPVDILPSCVIEVEIKLHNQCCHHKVDLCVRKTAHY